MLEQDRTEERIARHKKLQEDFTPVSVIEDMLESADGEMFYNFDKTILDNSCGTGNILCELLRHRLVYCKNVEDGYKAIRTIFGIELVEENVVACRNKLYLLFISKFSNCDKIKLNAILLNNIRLDDALSFNYDDLSIINI